MGRKPTPRTSYRQDAITIHRIATAVEEDSRSDSEWKAQVAEHLRAAMRLLLEHKFPGSNGAKVAASAREGRAKQ